MWTINDVLENLYFCILLCYKKVKQKRPNQYKFANFSKKKDILYALHDNPLLNRNRWNELQKVGKKYTNHEL